MFRRLAFVATALLCVGCVATANHLNRLSLGMTKQDVISEMGEPSSVSAEGNTEMLRYFLYPTNLAARERIEVPYFVKIEDGRVTAFGKVGDFGTHRENVDLTVNDQRSK